jgi:anti-sigma regulatory factor (Ser/Thr protein kinase)
MRKFEHMKVCMNVSFCGLAGFEKYRPHIELILSSLSVASLVKFRLAINEAIVNAIRYGDGGVNSAKVYVSIRYNIKNIVAKIRSYNEGFDVRHYIEKFQENPEVNIWESLKKRNRGRGLWLMLSGSERVLFSADGRDVILITKINNGITEKERNSERLLSKVHIF